MKYFYLRYLNFRLWRLRRRLRRLGFTEVASKVDQRIFDHPPDSRKILDCIKIAVGAIAIISMWLIFFLHQNGTAEAKPTPQEKPSLAAPFMPLKSDTFFF
jgi:hypothetical protein